VLETTFRVLRAVPPGHPVFEGHFPGQPLLPGALLLAEVQEALAAAPGWSAWLGPRPALSAAKFLAPVRPGDSLAVELRRQDGGAARAVDFSVFAGTVLAARGRWTAAVAAPADPVVA
jgi:3-hydroxymyristoyl/3-hydroxydecanoyl-(acyl carrier protein) dehydratase